MKLFTMMCVVANEVVYYDVCWSKAKPEAERKPIRIESFLKHYSI